MLKTVIGALVLVATANAVPGTAATSTANGESVTVRTNDLDLATAAGVKQLDARILSAARRMCKATEPNTGSRLQSKSSGECVRVSVAQARAKFAALAIEPRS